MYEISVAALRDKLVKAMRQKGWRPVDLARHSGIRASLIWKYLNPTAGRKARRPTVPQIDNLRKLSDALEISVEDLISKNSLAVREEPPEYHPPAIPPEIVMPIEVYHQVTAALKALTHSARVRDPVMRKRRKP